MTVGGLAWAWATFWLLAPEQVLQPKVVGRRPHDPGAFTQGLLIHEGRLFESTGRYGRSTVREIDTTSGKILRQRDLPRSVWGEGLARVPNISGGGGDQLVQLTWRDGIAFVWDLETFAAVKMFTYSGEGWGLCFDGRRLVMSDGSDRLFFRHPRTFAKLGEVRVTEGGQPRHRLNELECVGGAVFANVWPTDTVVRINPDSGKITAVYEVARLLAPREATRADVLNGIAHLGQNRFLLTGKWWPWMFEVVLGPGGGSP